MVVYDHRVHARLLRRARPDAERIDVGAAAPKPLEQDAICFLLAEKARDGKTVVRLKWGDPFVFDSGGKEALFLHEQGVPFEVVPGIPVAIGGPAYAGIPVTYPEAGERPDAHSRPRKRIGRRRPTWTGPGWPGRPGRSCATPARGRFAAMSQALHLPRPSTRRNRGAHLRRDAARRSEPSRARSETIVGARRYAAAGAPGRRRGRRAALAPALVRRPPALGPPHRGYALARAGGRAHRHARGTRRRGDPGADAIRITPPEDPAPLDAACRRTPARSTGSSSPARTRSITSCDGCSRTATCAICTASASAPSGRRPRRVCSVTAFAST